MFDLSAGDSRKFLCNGDFVSLFVQNVQGYVSVDLLTTTEVTVYQTSTAQSARTQSNDDPSSLATSAPATRPASMPPTASVPNFEQSCIFQIKTVTDTQPGAPLKYGDVVRIVHRSTHRPLARGTKPVDGSFIVSLNSTSSKACEHITNNQRRQCRKR